MDQNEKSVPTHETQRQETPKPESLGKVLAEMRKRDHRGRRVRFNPGEWSKLCARLDAAINRTLIELATAVATKAVNYTNEKWEREKTVAQDDTVFCNAAAMRATLIWIDEDINREAALNEEMSISDAVRIGQIRAALDRPPRNCDQTKDDAEAAFAREFCRAWDTTEDELATWLFAKAEKKGGAQ